MSEPIVQTTAGTVRGRLVDGIAIFKGIPFAAPPVGEHRFQAPAPVQPWPIRRRPRASSGPTCHSGSSNSDGGWGVLRPPGGP